MKQFWQGKILSLKDCHFRGVYSIWIHFNSIICFVWDFANLTLSGQIEISKWRKVLGVRFGSSRLDFSSITAHSTCWVNCNHRLIQLLVRFLFHFNSHPLLLCVWLLLQFCLAQQVSIWKSEQVEKESNYKSWAFAVTWSNAFIANAYIIPALL